MRIMIPADSKVYDESVTGKKSGQSWTFKRQRAWALFANGERRQVSLDVPKSQPNGWPAGEYIIGPNSFMVGRFGGIALGNLELLPAPASKAA